MQGEKDPVQNSLYLFPSITGQRPISHLNGELVCLIGEHDAAKQKQFTGGKKSLLTNIRLYDWDGTCNPFTLFSKGGYIFIDHIWVNPKCVKYSSGWDVCIGYVHKYNRLNGFPDYGINCESSYFLDEDYDTFTNVVKGSSLIRYSSGEKLDYLIELKKDLKRAVKENFCYFTDYDYDLDSFLYDINSELKKLVAPYYLQGPCIMGMPILSIKSKDTEPNEKIEFFTNRLTRN